ncbi:hypothetical protein CRUP_030548 [Coryphaenoides rupestris]|nr:hypothetical protein CRUP_030548 [Coryphaenoides rupestris]
MAVRAVAVTWGQMEANTVLQTCLMWRLGWESSDSRMSTTTSAQWGSASSLAVGEGGMLASVASLMKKAKKEATPENHSFQQLLMLVGIHLFKSPEELVDTMQDIHSCIQKAQEKKKKRKSQAKEEAEPHWAEVVVDILLSLLSQPSRHIRQVCKTVFASICPHVTATALTAILDVLDPDKDEEESALVVTNQDPTKQEGQDEEMKEVEKPGRYQLAPEMETYVTNFLQGSLEEPDKQLAVLVGFSKVTNWGNPVVSSSWRVVQHLGPAALQRASAYCTRQ